MSIHVHTAPEQPATRFEVPLCESSRPLVFTNDPEALIVCQNCKRARRAQNLVVQVYFDLHRFFCKRGHGCRKADP